MKPPTYHNIQRAGFILLAALLLSAAGCSSSPDKPQADADSGQPVPDAVNSPDGDVLDDDAPDHQTPTVTVRVATFNSSLFRPNQGQLQTDLAGGDAQAKKVAEVLQRVRPDIVLINEFDWDAEAASARIFAEDYLAVSQRGAEPLEFPYSYVPDTNTGVHSGIDLNKDGQVDPTPGSQTYGNDAFGFGTFHGQYGMVIFSRYPIDTDAIRTFQTFLWKDMPDNLLPADWYSAEAVEILRLSSKNHVDVPVEVDGHTIHVLASHPTPPSFDGPEDRNGRHNHDEIKFWVDYISGEAASGYIYDDAGNTGGLADDAAFVLLGDLNSDPHDGDSRRGALVSFLAHPRVQDPEPKSEGAVEKNEADGRANTTHEGDPALDTADFSDGQVGNLRVDYALPSANLNVESAGVFWPATGETHADLAGVSDHHLVWVDVTVGLGED